MLVHCAGGPNTPLQVTATTICLGYFLFDFAWCLYFQTEGKYFLFDFVWCLCFLTEGKYFLFDFVWCLCFLTEGKSLLTSVWATASLILPELKVSHYQLSGLHPL